MELGSLAACLVAGGPLLLLDCGRCSCSGRRTMHLAKREATTLWLCCKKRSLAGCSAFLTVANKQVTASPPEGTSHDPRAPRVTRLRRMETQLPANCLSFKVQHTGVVGEAGLRKTMECLRHGMHTYLPSKSESGVGTCRPQGGV